jgi:hypothetical protein
MNVASSAKAIRLRIDVDMNAHCFGPATARRGRGLADGRQTATVKVT